MIVAVDPRRTETADFADLHLPIRPGTDIALLNSMLYVLIGRKSGRPQVYRATHAGFCFVASRW